MIFEVVSTPRSVRHLNEIFDYIAERGDPLGARAYTRDLETTCLSLNRFPLRGTPRDDIRPGLRTLVHRRSATTAFSVEGHVVVIHGVFGGGQDHVAVLREIGKSETK